MIPPREVLQRNLAEHLEALPTESLAVIHDLVIELELRTAWAEFSEGMTADWLKGKYENLEVGIKAAREQLRTSKGL